MCTEAIWMWTKCTQMWVEWISMWADLIPIWPNVSQYVHDVSQCNVNRMVWQSAWEGSVPMWTQLEQNVSQCEQNASMWAKSVTLWTRRCLSMWTVAATPVFTSTLLVMDFTPRLTVLSLLQHIYIVHPGSSLVKLQNHNTLALKSFFTQGSVRRKVRSYNWWSYCWKALFSGQTFPGETICLILQLPCFSLPCILGWARKQSSRFADRYIAYKHWRVKIAHAGSSWVTKIVYYCQTLPIPGPKIAAAKKLLAHFFRFTQWVYLGQEQWNPNRLALTRVQSCT